MRDMEHESEFLTQIPEEERERGRVGTAGDGEDQRTGAEECVGAGVCADCVEDRRRRCV
jgi:hypothetical protein